MNGVNVCYVHIALGSDCNSCTLVEPIDQVVVTADRYVAVCRPLKSHLRTLSRAKSAVICVVVTSLVYNVPSFFERHVVELLCSGSRIAVVRQTALRSHYVYFVVYKTALYFLFRTAGPLAALTALNVRLVVALRELRQRRRRLKVRLHSPCVTCMAIVYCIVCRL